MKLIFIFISCLLLSSAVLAVCTLPAGVMGQMQWIAADGKVKFCDGTNWKDTSQSTGAASGGAVAGTINFSAGNLSYSNGINWIKMNSSTDLGLCTGTLPGTYTWDAALGKMKMCDGITWYDLTASECFKRKVAFAADTSWSVPADNCGQIRIKAWGAGGGGLHDAFANSNYGGGGGFAQADITVVPGSSVIAVAIGGGGPGGGGYDASAGGAHGGGLGSGSFAWHGVAGGGFSGAFVGAIAFANSLVVAGGGGGAGYESGGSGGGATGASAPWITGCFYPWSLPTGGTQTGGGLACDHTQMGAPAQPGGPLLGGNSNWRGGGGGGGGYYGGGGGDYNECDPGFVPGGGAGGSSYVGGAPGFSAANTISTSGAPGAAANAGDPDYVAGKAVGGTTGNGGPGYVVIYY